jgi:hypothetical protein
MSRILTTNFPSTEVSSSLECAGEIGKRSAGETDFVATSPNIAILSQDISRQERSQKAILVACVRGSEMTDGIFTTCGPILSPRRSLNKGVLKEYLDYSNSTYVVTKAYQDTKPPCSTYQTPPLSLGREGGADSCCGHSCRTNCRCAGCSSGQRRTKYSKRIFQQPRSDPTLQIIFLTAISSSQQISLIIFFSVFQNDHPVESGQKRAFVLGGSAMMGPADSQQDLVHSLKRCPKTILEIEQFPTWPGGF